MTRARLLVTALLAPTLLAAAVAMAGPASAATPEGWPDVPSISPTFVVFVLIGVPLVMFALITAALYLPPIVRGERVTPGATAPEDEWLGGPRKSAGELAAPDTESSQAGGASGRW